MQQRSMSKNNMNETAAKTCKLKEELAFCILWSPLPPITFILPFIGHMGISDSNGIASDFQGPYNVGDQGRMAFGSPTRALKADITSLPGGAEQWDSAIRHANGVYRGRMHNICCDNCHSHVACALNRMDIKISGVSKFNMVKLCFLVFFRARFLSFKGFLSQFLPFIVVVLIIVLVGAL